MKADTLQITLAKYARRMACDNLTIGSSGNLSGRAGGKICIKQSSKAFLKSKPSDFIYLNIKKPKIKPGRQPSCEYNLHIGCYEKRPDIKAVFHVHPVFATTLYSASAKHSVITLEFALYIKQPIPIVDFMPPGSLELARAVAGAALKNDVIIIKQHGLVALGRTLHEAYLKALIVEREQKAALICRIMRKAPKYLSRRQIDSLSKA
jgi:L-fuculose-phosphate aldolase